MKKFKKKYSQYAKKGEKIESYTQLRSQKGTKNLETRIGEKNTQ